MQLVFAVVVALAGLAVLADGGPAAAQSWSRDEIITLRSLWIGSLPKLPNEPSNAYADNLDAARLGQALFFDPRFSGNGEVSCATCHKPELSFTDGLELAEGMGTAPRHTPTIIGAAYSPWLFWDGRKDSQWSQALGPMESPVEHGGTRTQFAKIVFSDARYLAAYEAIFGPLPDVSDNVRFPPSATPSGAPTAAQSWARMDAADKDTVSEFYANLGKAIAAYERLILPGRSRFDRYVQAVLDGDTAAQTRLFDDAETEGLRLFIGRGNCIECHNGPLFTNNDFHNTGLPSPADAAPDLGRTRGITAAHEDEFNCLGPFSDAGPGDCGELKFAKTEGAELVGSFKTPTLRNVARTAPYLHDGQFDTLAAVLHHYNMAPAATVGSTQLVPLGLTHDEVARLASFLMTLDSSPDVDAAWLSPP